MSKWVGLARKISHVPRRNDFAERYPLFQQYPSVFARQQFVLSSNSSFSYIASTGHISPRFGVLRQTFAFIEPADGPSRPLEVIFLLFSLIPPLLLSWKNPFFPLLFLAFVSGENPSLARCVSVTAIYASVDGARMRRLAPVDN